MKNSLIGGKALEEQEELFITRIVEEKKAILILDLDNTILHSIEMFKVSEEVLESL